MFVAFALILVCCLQTQVQGYYLPGVSPKNYEEGEAVEVDVNALRSPNSVIPYEYYYKMFGFCELEPEKRKASDLSFGSILLGDRVHRSAYQMNMLENKECSVLCSKELDKSQINFLYSRIQEKYYVNILIDSLPAARKSRTKTGEVYNVGFSLGGKVEKRSFLNNHHRFVVEYHENDGKYNVVGVTVYSSSRDYVLDANGNVDCKVVNPLEIIQDKEKSTITYTYEVEWVRSEKPWATRWDHFLQTTDTKIHWFSLINSFAIVIFLTFMVAVILVRNLHKDIARYNSRFESQEESLEEYGWKLIHADVFRSPSHPALLSVFAGNGVQLFFMSCAILVLALLGFLSPSMRGSLATVSITFYVCFGFAAGYTSSRLYKMMGGESWKKNIILTAFLVPGSLSIILVILNFFLIVVKSSAAVPIGTLAGLLAMWILVSTPLSFIGSYLGFKAPRIENPVKVNQIPRIVPPQPFYLQPLPSILLGGILPFGAIFIEFYFIMSSIWFNSFYYVFGFLALVFIILSLTCSQVAILMCYFHLCSEEHRWWWRSFLTTGCTALYAFILSTFYFFYKLEMANLVSGILYFGWTGAMCFVLFVLTGTIGFLPCLWFVRTIYASIRVD